MLAYVFHRNFADLVENQKDPLRYLTLGLS